MQNFNLENLETELENRFPTPLVLVNLINQEKELSDRFWSFEKECATVEILAEREADRKQSNVVDTLITEAAISENHLLTLVRRSLFITDLSSEELNTLTLVSDFSDQMELNTSKLYDEALIDTLLLNGINTAKQFESLITGYFSTIEMQDIRNYLPVNPKLKKFIGLNITDHLTLALVETFTDEDTGKEHEIPLDKIILSKGIITERSLQTADHDQIMTVLQNQLDDVIADEDYAQARVLQTQLDELK